MATALTEQKRFMPVTKKSRYDGEDRSFRTTGLLIEAGFLKLAYHAQNGLLMGTQLGSLTAQRHHNRFGEVERENSTQESMPLLSTTNLEINFLKEL